MARRVVGYYPIAPGVESWCERVAARGREEAVSSVTGGRLGPDAGECVTFGEAWRPSRGIAQYPARHPVYHSAGFEEVRDMDGWAELLEGAEPAGAALRRVAVLRRQQSLITMEVG